MATRGTGSLQLHDSTGALLEAQNLIIRPDGFTIPFSASQVHGISTERALAEGLPLIEVLATFNQTVAKARVLAGHNIEFDINILGAEFLRTGLTTEFLSRPFVCTKDESTDYCALPGGKGGRPKWPTLAELHHRLFGSSFAEAHNAQGDVIATARCFFELIRLGIITPDKARLTPDQMQTFLAANPAIVAPVTIAITSNFVSPNTENIATPATPQPPVAEKAAGWIPLHVHTQYSILDGAADIKSLIKKAKKDGMKAVAITDHGSMFGVKEFHKTALKEDIKPILGCEVYVARRSRHEKNDKTDGGGEHLVLLAKNKTGYHNLMRMVSLGWLEGYYYKPRIDKDLLREHHEGLIACSACLGGEIARRIVNDSPEAAGKTILEYREIFGDDFYLELQRHPSGDPAMDKEVYNTQQFVNKALLELGQQYGVKCVATNDSHFVNPEDAPAHDRLICLSTGKDLDDPNRMRYTGQEWFKTQAEMIQLFADLPQVVQNTLEIVEKVEQYELNTKPIMPDFALPEGFAEPNDYLRHITYEGARFRWGEISAEAAERLDFELETIKRMGFPGYFLIIWDFLKAAREMGVSVGPGRGSAAGSAVAYCLRITEIDPIRYQLLFERFLNPDRVSMPDIDIDFDEDGRGRVLEYVVNKYGSKRVAHIITFGTMAAKSAIRDVARVQGLPLPEADKLAKLVPERPGVSLEEAYNEVPELKQARNKGPEEIASVLKYAEILEGSVRNTGTHACGVIIGKNDLEEHIPISTAKDSELTYVTQYDGKHVEDVGLLKMDFLGLKTLSIIKDAVENVKLSKDIDLDIDKAPIDDAATYELYSKGETTGLFQFESDGMKKYLKELKPNRFEDLIAMNALYRPGPMDYIPNYINRKHGREPIRYDLAEMEEYLKDTYGITVYQEQVMQLSQKLAGFTKGQADSLRKAMGKKIRAMMDDLKVKFMEGAIGLGHKKDILEKVWGDWESFAEYAFNKSHSTCYAYVSYQTAYLKTHHPAEFMAAVLSRNLNDIKKITFFMDECRRMGLPVLGPDVNESYARFMVNKKGQIRFGLAAVKGVGESVVEHLIEKRTEKGPFKDIYDFVSRVNTSIVNKRCLEALAMAGAFDDLQGIGRHHYFGTDDKGTSFIEALLRFGNRMQSEGNAAPTLFGDSHSVQIVRPEVPKAPEWPVAYKLNKEKEHIGMYLSSHPLDAYKFELKNLNITPLQALKDLKELQNRDITVVGMVTAAAERTAKNGKPFGSITIEDYTDSYSFMLFGNDYLQFKNYFTVGYHLLIKGKAQENPWKKENPELEFKLNSVKLLSEIRDDWFKSVSLRVPAENVNRHFIDQIKTFSGNKNGKLLLKVSVFDVESNINVDLFSRQLKLGLTEEVVDFLEHSQDFEYSIA